MKFDELNAHIPYAVGGKQKSLSMNPYPGVTLRMPGRHARDTDPVGGDFVVEIILSPNGGQFTHGDIFQDLELKTEFDKEKTQELMEKYLKVLRDGDDPVKLCELTEEDQQKARFHMLVKMPGIWESVLLAGMQCLALAEHRRYAQHEARWGGRYLPFRFGAGIVEGLWTAADAIEKQKRGRPGVEWLERDHGVPKLTKELMND